MDETQKSFNINYKKLEELFLEGIEFIEKTINKSDFDKKLESLKEKIIKEYEKKNLPRQVKSSNDDENAIINANGLDDLVKAIQNTDEQPKLSDEDRENISTYLAERIDAYLLFGSLKKMNLCQRFFSKTHNKSFDNALSILKILIEKQLLPEDLYKKEELDLLTKPIINDALKILRCNNLIEKNKGYRYHILEEQWFEGTRYKIKDTEILQNLARPLLSFVRVNMHDKPSDFFTIIDELIKYILQTSSNHNANFELEKAIYETIAYLTSMTIILKDTGKSIEIFPNDINIVFDGNKVKKNLNYSPIDKEEEKDIDLSKIALYSSHTVNNASIPARSNPSASSNFSTFKMETKPKKIEKTNVILAVNSLLYEYFTNIDVFEDMEIITDLAYIETLQMEYIRKNRAEFNKLILTHDSVTPSADFFLLKIRDEHDFIAQEIQKNMQYIKIIHPLSMYDAIKENMTVFLKNELL
ncbi:MAG: hypothetical protein C0627_08870 [Sulfurimonas sp.]|nr:MAG: hypothetical protein C0627_08870 [Sulfurimonas sp.]